MSQLIELFTSCRRYASISSITPAFENTRISSNLPRFGFDKAANWLAVLVLVFDALQLSLLAFQSAVVLSLQLKSLSKLHKQISDYSRHVDGTPPPPHISSITPAFENAHISSKLPRFGFDKAANWLAVLILVFDALQLSLLAFQSAVQEDRDNGVEPSG